MLLKRTVLACTVRLSGINFLLCAFWPHLHLSVFHTGDIYAARARGCASDAEPVTVRGCAAPFRDPTIPPLTMALHGPALFGPCVNALATDAIVILFLPPSVWRSAALHTCKVMHAPLLWRHEALGYVRDTARWSVPLVISLCPPVTRATVWQGGDPVAATRW